MKLLPSYTEYFLSPWTGRIATSDQLPPLLDDYVWEGDVNNKPKPSPVLIDMRLMTSQLKNQVDWIATSKFILQVPNDQYLPNSQSLSILSTGILKNTTSTGVLSIAIPGTDYMVPILTTGKIWIGDSENKPSEIVVLPIANMANLGEGKIWIGNSSSRPAESSYIPFDNELTYVTTSTESSLPNSQALEPVGTGITKLETGGHFAIAVADEDYTSWSKFEELSNCTFIVQTANDIIPAAQALDTLPDGVMVNESGAINTSDEYVKVEGLPTPGNIAIFVDGHTIEDSETSIPELEELVEEAKTAAEEAKTSAEEATTAAEEASAAAEEASAAAGEATTAAAEATAAAGEASFAAGEASLSAGAAELSAGAALGSAALAAASATSAGDAEDAAEAARDAAYGARDSAASSASSAASSASSASTSASNALTSATAAAASESAAHVSELNAHLSEVSCTETLADMLATGISLIGDVSGSGPYNTSVVTILNLKLNQIIPPDGILSLNSQKITNLANGTASTDAVNVSQLTGGTVTSVTGSGNIASSGGTTPNITFTGILPIANGGTNVNSVTISPTASAFAGWDSNRNLSANNFLSSYTTTATAAGTTTLTIGSTYQQYFTGSTTQSLVLPVTSTLVLGQSFYIVNNSSGVVTVKSSGSNTIQAMAAGTTLLVTCILTSGTTAASWATNYILNTSLTLPLSLSNGGSNASLTASNGGIVYSTASALAISSAPSSSNKLVVSGASGIPSYVSNFIENLSMYLGNSAGFNDSTAILSYNTAIGTFSATNNSAGQFNTSVGTESLNSNGIVASTSYNTAIGTSTLADYTGALSSLGYNTALGCFSGSLRAAYSQCTFLGANADSSINNLTNASAIGYGAIVDSSNTMVLGNTSLVTVSTVANIITTGYVAGTVSKGSWYSTSTYNPSFTAGTALLTRPSSATAGTLVNFTHNQGILTYTGSRTRTMRFQYDIQLTLGASGANMTFWSSKNGGTVLGAQTRTGNTVTALNAGLQITTSFSDVISMSTNDTIQLVGQCATTTAGVAYNYVQFNIYEIGD